MRSGKSGNALKPIPQRKSQTSGNPIGALLEPYLDNEGICIVKVATRPLVCQS
jgi:hypothetical protein